MFRLPNTIRKHCSFLQSNSLYREAAAQKKSIDLSHSCQLPLKEQFIPVRLQNRAA